MPLLERWNRNRQGAVIPFLIFAKYYLHSDEFSYDDFVVDIQKSLKKEPNSPALRQMAYVAAMITGDDARRLFFACKLAEMKKSPDRFYIYGTELKLNLMNKKAESIFRCGLQQDKRHINCMLGLGACYLERLDITGRFFDNETRGHGITLQSAS